MSTYDGMTKAQFMVYMQTMKGRLNIAPGVELCTDGEDVWAQTTDEEPVPLFLIEWTGDFTTKCIPFKQ